MRGASARIGPTALTLLVDAPSLVYRALFSTPDSVRTPGGEPINAAHGFLNMLARLVADQRPDRLACAEDADWRPAWRVDLVPTYKLHRTMPDSPAVAAEERLKSQIPVLWRVLELCGVPVIGSPGFEAEDIIGTLAARAAPPVAIFSGDRDLFQLVAGSQVRVLYPRRGTSDLICVDEPYIAAQYGIPPRAYADYAVLRGDASDGLPGVKGIGEKMAAALVNRYGSLDAILAAADAAGPAAPGPLGKVRRDRDYIERARQVVRIRTDVPVPDVDLDRRAPAGDDLWDLAREQGLTGGVTRLLEALA
ncbi:MAG TPA: 5'-3' exonuclease [Actinomycetota bacterium]|nr:5'-3' exonuclease [Actinomycetota bacterium]